MCMSKLRTSAKLVKIRNHFVETVPDNTLDKNYPENTNYVKKLLSQIVNVWVGFGDNGWVEIFLLSDQLSSMYFYLHGVSQNIINIKFILIWSQVIDEEAKPLHNHMKMYNNSEIIFNTYNQKYFVLPSRCINSQLLFLLLYIRLRCPRHIYLIVKK